MKDFKEKMLIAFIENYIEENGVYTTLDFLTSIPLNKAEILSLNIFNERNVNDFFEYYNME